jgi:hypothetical protein
MADVNARAAEMFAAGDSINAVAKALFKSDWGKANKLYKAWKGGDINAAPVDGRKKRGRPLGGAALARDEEAVEVEIAELPDVWDMTLNVPREKVPALFSSFTEAEQATAVLTIIQARMDALLGA